MKQHRFDKLVSYLSKVPAIEMPVSNSGLTEELWWVKFSININHVLAWKVVQEFAHVINYISLGERLPTSFYPVSPPPYMNGGPEEFLSWVIESRSVDFTPDQMFQWLQGRLPSPVEDIDEWQTEEEDE